MERNLFKFWFPYKLSKEMAKLMLFFRDREAWLILALAV